MNRTKSSLVVYTKLSPNCTKPRTKKICRLTPHCAAGNLTMESLLGLSRFVEYDPKNGASCNYAIDTDGRIGLGVEETNRAWTTSSYANDHEAITFEISNNGGGPDWRISDAAINAWMDLAIDICKAYGFKKVNYQTKPAHITSSGVEAWIKTWSKPDEMIITLHTWYANKSCPGPYFIRQLPWIVKALNKRLSGQSAELFVGEGSGPITTKPSAKPATDFEPYQIVMNAPALNVRKGPGLNQQIVQTLINDKNVYTIVEESDGVGANKWGKLKSGIGWISLDYTTRR